jgi:hypothetical protein
MLRSITFFNWLLSMATFNYAGLIGVVVITVWGVRLLKISREAVLILVLPLFWLTPMVLAGAFAEPAPQVKIAYWVGVIALPVFVLQLAWSGLAVLRLRRQKDLRDLAWIGSGVNGFIGLMAWFVVGMASTGTWL